MICLVSLYGGVPIIHVFQVNRYTFSCTIFFFNFKSAILIFKKVFKIDVKKKKC